MKLVGYMVWDLKTDKPYKYTRAPKQVFSSEAAAMKSRGHAPHTRIVPVYAHDAPPEPKAYCRSCGRPEDDHHVRHPFVPA